MPWVVFETIPSLELVTSILNISTKNTAKFLTITFFTFPLIFSQYSFPLSRLVLRLLRKNQRKTKMLKKKIRGMSDKALKSLRMNHDGHERSFMLYRVYIIDSII